MGGERIMRLFATIIAFTLIVDYFYGYQPQYFLDNFISAAVFASAIVILLNIGINIAVQVLASGTEFGFRFGEMGTWLIWIGLTLGWIMFGIYIDMWLIISSIFDMLTFNVTGVYNKINTLAESMFKHGGIVWTTFYAIRDNIPYVGTFLAIGYFALAFYSLVSLIRGVGE